MANPYICPNKDCNRVYYSKVQIKDHIKRFQKRGYCKYLIGKNGNELKCINKKCNKVFYSPVSYKAHIDYFEQNHTCIKKRQLACHSSNDLYESVVSTVNNNNDYESISDFVRKAVTNELNKKGEQ